VEAGDTGRHRVSGGEVIRHEAFESHLNRFEAKRAEVLVLTFDWREAAVIGRVHDPDGIARLAEHDPVEAVRSLIEQFLPSTTQMDDWPDELAAALIERPSLSLREWASIHGFHPGSLSRGFREQFGITPAEFRCITKFHRARALLSGGRRMLAEIAVEAGFSDQSHMSREVKRRSGSTATELVSDRL
jgi:AraC-like DNA-binding protein